MKVVSGLALILVSVTAMADERWQYSGDGIEDGFGIYLDTTTLERDGDYANAWFEYRYTAKKDGFRDLALFRINCARRSLRLDSKMEYDANGKLLRSASASSAEAPIAPQSVGEMLWGAACPEEAKPLGLKQVQTLGDRLRREDADFDRKFAEISESIGSIQAIFPPTLWAAVIELEWSKLK